MMIKKRTRPLAQIFRTTAQACVQLLGIVVLIGCFAIGLNAQESGEKRIALVIGNGAYQNVPGLDNPGNDAADLSAELRRVGFEVILQTDLTQGKMLDVLRKFRRTAVGADVALIYFAGHGIEIDRQNYLIPVDAVLETDADVNFETVRLDTMMFATSGAKRLSIIIVDACRDNPFATSMKQSSSSRSIGRGLSAVEPTQNTLVAYAAKEGTTAADGTGRNSPYASALIKALRQPNLEIGLMMRQVRDEVLKTTNGQQEPFMYGSLSADEIFLNETRGLKPVETIAAPAPEIGADAVEIAFWQSASQSSNVSELENYLSRYPDGHFADLARSRIASYAGAAPAQDQLASVDPTDETRNFVPERDLTRSEIVEVQERLSTLGFSPGTADGIAGPRTNDAIGKFEETIGLPTNGQANASILSALRDYVSDAELSEWRSTQVKRQPAPTATKRKQPTTQATTQTTPAKPKPTSTEKEASTEPSGSYSKFCASNQVCATRECRGGGSTPVWRKTQKCQLCRIYAAQCE